MTHALLDRLRHFRPEKLPGMKPFNESSNIGCPWWSWCLKDPVGELPRGILVMQDWGVDGETFQEAVDTLENSSKRLPDSNADRTLKNLFDERREWGRAIVKRQVLVTNAAWGLREGKDKCSYLGAKTHKAAFLTWVHLVASIAEAKSDDEFRLFAAGCWATFDDGKNPSDLRDYLMKWQNWASQGRYKVDGNIGSLEKCRGKVVYLRHPCLWQRMSESEVSPWARTAP
ncbi:MAG: hypothetical protein CJBNEKGG_03056 [Prosthecobacter sp.]|nr:hypothetical protein [Prosthecobacter sp.]